MLIPTGVPFSYFKDTEPFSSWFNDGYLLPLNDPWINNIFLHKFKAQKYIDHTHSDRKTYSYTIELKAKQEIRTLLNNPAGILLSFGSDDDTRPNNLIIKIIPIVNKYGKLGDFRTEISGDVHFIFPSGFLYPVKKVANKWKKDNAKDEIEIELGNSVINYNEGGRIQLSYPLSFKPDTTVFIAGKNIVVRLDKLDISYSDENKPEIKFINASLILK